ncbi:MAG: FBP domain-containing protein [Candidatus Azotimanducaceae bacterium]|nr:hypothetical protein [Gammaproteobacteria bacterium]
MDSISQDEISHVFGVEQVFLPDVSVIEWNNLDYLGWVHPSGSQAYVVLVSPETGRLAGGILNRTLRVSIRQRFEMCSWCHHVHRYNGTAMFTLSVKGTRGRHYIGKVLCKNLDCSLRIRNLIEPSSYMTETLYTEARVWRMQKSMHRWLKKAKRL